MIKQYLPINLNLEGKLCLVVGAGKVAERKVNNLLVCGAKVKVISPVMSEPLKAFKFDWIKDDYKKDYLKGVYLVIAATDSKRVNAQVSQDAKEKKILVNVVDSAQESDFIFPAVLRKDNMTLSVSSNATDPKRSKAVRDELRSYRFKS